MGNVVPDWSNWVTFVLKTLATLATLGAAVWGWRNRRRPLRLSFSVQPYGLAGQRIGNSAPAPSELLQLDIRNMSSGPMTLTGVRMTLVGSKVEQPVFNEGLGESWIVRKSIAPGDTVFVKCSHSNEDVLPRIRRIRVYANGIEPVTIGSRAVRRGLASLKARRKT
jgi:hypothetical protein